MNTNELISMVTERNCTMKKNMTTLSEDFFNFFKENLSQKLNDNPRLSYAKKIGITIVNLCETDFKTSGVFTFLFDDEGYETEDLSPLDNYVGPLFDSFKKEYFETFFNLLKDYGFKLFVNKSGCIVPFIEID